MSHHKYSTGSHYHLLYSVARRRTQFFVIGSSHFHVLDSHSQLATNGFTQHHGEAKVTYCTHDSSAGEDVVVSKGLAMEDDSTDAKPASVPSREEQDSRHSSKARRTLLRTPPALLEAIRKRSTASIEKDPKSSPQKKSQGRNASSCNHRR